MSASARTVTPPHVRNANSVTSFPRIVVPRQTSERTCPANRDTSEFEGRAGNTAIARDCKMAICFSSSSQNVAPQADTMHQTALFTVSPSTTACLSSRTLDARCAPLVGRRRARDDGCQSSLRYRSNLRGTLPATAAPARAQTATSTSVFLVSMGYTQDTMMRTEHSTLVAQLSLQTKSPPLRLSSLVVL